MPPAIARMESQALLSNSPRASLQRDAMTAVKTFRALFGVNGTCNASKGVFVGEPKHAPRRLGQVAGQRIPLPPDDPGQHDADAPPLPGRQRACHQGPRALVGPGPMREAHSGAGVGLDPLPHLAGRLHVRSRAGMEARQKRRTGGLDDLTAHASSQRKTKSQPR